MSTSQGGSTSDAKGQGRRCKKRATIKDRSRKGRKRRAKIKDRSRRGKEMKWMEMKAK